MDSVCPKGYWKCRLGFHCRKWRVIDVEYFSKNTGQLKYTRSGQRGACIRCGSQRVKVDQRG